MNSQSFMKLALTSCIFILIWVFVRYLFIMKHLSSHPQVSNILLPYAGRGAA